MLDAVVRWLLDWAGWIVAALGVGVAIYNARAAHRSAGAAKESADAARGTLEHAQETERRRTRLAVGELVAQVAVGIVRVLNLAQSLEAGCEELIRYRGSSPELERSRESYASIPTQLESCRKRIQRRGTESLRRLSTEELEDLQANLAWDLNELRFRFEILTKDLGSLKTRLDYEEELRDGRG